MAKKKKTSGRFYSISEAAKILGISRPAVYRAIAENRLRAEDGTFEVVRMVKMKVHGKRISTDSLHSYRVNTQAQEAGKKSEIG